MLGIIWIGLFGSFGALILRLSNSGPGFENVGTDTLFLVVVGVIANDVAAFLSEQQLVELHFARGSARPRRWKVSLVGQSAHS